MTIRKTNFVHIFVDKPLMPMENTFNKGIIIIFVFQLNFKKEKIIIIILVSHALNVEMTE